jgi:hypothetical protein
VVRRLDLAIVLRADEEECTVFSAEKSTVVPFAAVFPRPRRDRVAPGHLVAVAALPDGRDVVIWRWFDAVVVEVVGLEVRVWEPVHGEVIARPRDEQAVPQPGSRAYVSAGLPGAEWWLAGPAVTSARFAEVDLDEVERFFTDNELWHAVQP